MTISANRGDRRLGGSCSVDLPLQSPFPTTAARCRPRACRGACSLSAHLRAVRPHSPWPRTTARSRGCPRRVLARTTLLDGGSIGLLRRGRRRRYRWRADQARLGLGRSASCCAGRRARRPPGHRAANAASSAAVMNACRRLCGVMGLFTPARRATRRTIRAAQCRSIRCPSARRKIGPSKRSPMVRSTASGMVTNLAALAQLWRLSKFPSVARRNSSPCVVVRVVVRGRFGLRVGVVGSGVVVAEPVGVAVEVEDDGSVE